MKKPEQELIVINSLDEIPERFDSEDDEREWWATHDLSAELYGSLEDVTDELDEIAPVPGGPLPSRKTTRKAS